MQQIAQRHERLRVDRIRDIVVGKQRSTSIHRDEEGLERVGYRVAEPRGPQGLAGLRVEEIAVLGGIVPGKMR